MRIAQVPQCLTKTSPPFRLTSRSSQLSSAAPARSEAPLAKIHGPRPSKERRGPRTRPKSSGRAAEKKHRGQWQRRSGVSSSARSALGRKQLAALPSTSRLLHRSRAAALRCAATVRLPAESRSGPETRFFGYKCARTLPTGFTPYCSLTCSSTSPSLKQFFLSGHIASLLHQLLHLLHLHPHPGISHHIHHIHRDLYHISSTAVCSATSGFWRSPQPPNQGTCLGLRIRYHSLYRLLRLPRSSIASHAHPAALCFCHCHSAFWTLVRSLLVYNHSRSLFLSTQPDPTSTLPFLRLLAFSPLSAPFFVAVCRYLVLPQKRTSRACTGQFTRTSLTTGAKANSPRTSATTKTKSDTWRNLSPRAPLPSTPNCATSAPSLHFN